MNALYTRDLLLAIMQDPRTMRDPLAQPCLSRCQDLIKQARKTNDGKSREERCQALADDILTAMQDADLVSVRDVPVLIDYFKEKAKTIKPSEDIYFGLEKLISEMQNQTLLTAQEKGRQFLFKSLQHPHAQSFLQQCRDLIYTAKQHYDPSQAEKKCTELVNNLMSKVKYFALVSEKNAPFVNKCLLSKIKNPKSYPQQPIERLEVFFKKMNAKTMLDKSEKAESNRFEKDNGNIY